MPVQAKRGGVGTAPTHSQPGARRTWVASITLRPLYPWERFSTHCTGSWVCLGAGLDGMKNLASTGIRSPDSLAHSKLS